MAGNQPPTNRSEGRVHNMETSVYDKEIGATKSRQNNKAGRENEPQGGTDNANVVCLPGTERQRQWTIKGLPQETVEVTRAAAKRSGMKLNSWVSGTLKKAAEAEMANSSAISSGAEAELSRRVHELEEYIRVQMTQLQEQGREIENSINSINKVLMKVLSKELG